MLLGKPNIPYNFNDLNIRDNKNYSNNIQDLLLQSAKDNAVVWINGLPVYAEDIRADYIKKEIYAPVYMCDNLVDKKEREIRYNHRIKKVVIWDKVIKLTEIVIQPNIQTNEAFRIGLSELRLRETEIETDAKSLFYRYIASSYEYASDEVDYFKFSKVLLSNQPGYVKDYIAEHNLKFYGEYLPLDYRDVRNYKLIELLKKFSPESLMREESFGFRRLNFELELLTRLVTKQYWDEWTLGTIDELLSNKRNYLKYKENGIYLIFKRNWIV